MQRVIYKLNLILLASAIIGFLLIIVVPGRAYATGCTTPYGGGTTCVINKSFKIVKEVRIEGDDDYEEKVTGVEEGDVIEFKITVENTTDDGGVSGVSFDNMKIKDNLPDELIKLSGDLTEEWDDFEPGDKKTVKIKVKVDKKEFDDENFEKCVVNRVELTYDGDYEGSDTATVCYENGDKEIKELPETGATGTVMLLGLGLSSIVSGIVLKGYRVRVVY